MESEHEFAHDPVEQEEALLEVVDDEELGLTEDEELDIAGEELDIAEDDDLTLPGDGGVGPGA